MYKRIEDRWYRWPRKKGAAITITEEQLLTGMDVNPKTSIRTIENTIPVQTTKNMPESLQDRGIVRVAGDVFYIAFRSFDPTGKAKNSFSLALFHSLTNKIHVK